MAVAVSSIATFILVLSIRGHVTQHDTIARAAIVDFVLVKATVDSIDSRLRRVEHLLIAEPE